MDSSATDESSATSRCVFVVTGANTGVGFQTALQLAVGDDAGVRHIILACRTPAKAQAAVERIVSKLPSGSNTVVEWMQIDLASLRSIEAFVAEFKRRELPLHVLINNAGVNAPPALTPSTFKVDGQFVANYLGPYVLTKLLLPTLRASVPSRVINVSSYMHRLGLTDFETECRRSNTSSYSTSKLAQIYHSYDLQAQYGEEGVTAFVVHPGACNSDIWNTLKPAAFRPFAKALASTIFLTTEQGAAASVHAATKAVSSDPKECEHFGPYPTPLPGFEYFTDAWQPSCFTRVTKSKTSGVTYDKKIGAALMVLSEKLYGEWRELDAVDKGQGPASPRSSL